MGLPIYPLDRWPQNRTLETGGIWQPACALFAVEGTVYPGAPFDPVPLTDNHYENENWCGFASGTVGGVINVADGLCHCECVGYPALTANMGASAALGGTNTAIRTKIFTDTFHNEFGFYPMLKYVGWSQGAWALDMFMRDHIINPDGDLHYLLPYVDSVYNYGDVFRTSGISKGDEYGGFPGPGKEDGEITGGIAGPEQLTIEQSSIISKYDGRFVFKSFNRNGDLYGAAPMGKAPVTKSSMPSSGKVEYSFFKMIEHTSAFVVIGGLMGDLVHVIGDIKAGGNAIKFFSAAQNAPHFKYWDEMNWVINDIVTTARTQPHNLGV